MRKINYFIKLSVLIIIGCSFLLMETTGMNIVVLEDVRLDNLSSNDEDAHLPIWNQGDFWEYNIGLLYDSETVVIDIFIEKILFEVHTITSDIYKLDFHGTITGSINLANIVAGNIMNTEIDGALDIRKSDLAVITVSDVVIEGDIQRQFITTSFHSDMEIYQNITPVVSPYNFPITINETWTVPNMTFWVDLSASVDLAVPVERIFSFPLVIREHHLTCTRKETLIGSYGSFNDSYSVSGGVSQYNFWFSPTAHNVIRCQQNNIILWQNETPFVLIDKIDIDLVNTNFQPTNVPPMTPQKPSGTTSGEAGTSYPYTTHTTDTDGDQILYLFNWGDGTDSGWIGPYSSGEIATAEKEWGNRGTYSIKVKAKDTLGLESDYSDPLTVTMPKKTGATMNLLPRRFLEILRERSMYLPFTVTYIP